MRIEKTGEIATAALLISALSGFLLAYQYEVAEPFISATAIETVIPFGAFWRSVHFWSSQAFFLVLILHIWQCTGSMDRFCRHRKGRIHWTVVSLTLPLAMYALFTGYVLRFDGTGQAAGKIAEHLLLNVPIAGSMLDRMLMATSTEGLNRVYTVHILFTALCWGLGTWYHTRRVTVGRKIFLYTLTAVVITGVLIHAPIDLPGQNLHLIKGPWFFLGIQELLRHMAPITAGIIFPMIPLAIVALFPWLRKRSGIYSALAIWSSVYIIATVVTLAR